MISKSLTKNPFIVLTDGIFESDAFGVPSKSQNPTTRWTPLTQNDWVL